MATSENLLAGRCIIVTGGGRGLGREMALALATAGARVLITGAREGDELAQTTLDARELAGEISSMQADVRDFKACEAVVAQTLERFGAVHALVNNAGRGMRLISETFTTEPVRFWEAAPISWREIVDINLIGTFNMARAVTPILVEQGFGKLINISTSAQTMVRQGYSPYGPSKAGLEAASRCWAQELDGTGVSVNVLLPGGATDTALLPDSPVRQGADGMLLSPALMRAPIVWLCSDAANTHSGKRYIARLWDETLAADEAARRARDDSTTLPAIM